jgi:hypothetical protein
MEALKKAKNAVNYYCEKCNFKCSKKSNYDQHLLTAKHKKEANGSIKPAVYICEFCEKQYKSRGSFWKHQQKCDKVPYFQEQLQEPPTKPTDSAMIIELLKQNQEFKQLMMDQSRQIQETQSENQELQKQLIEAVKVSGSHIENQTITNNNNNQKFNLNFFLNEQCKDAINMSDFIENMELDIEDLTETGRLGYVGGISRILVNKLQELDIYKRPLHCTDMKRETLYIKENDEWSKEDNSKDKMSNIIGQVANKNCRNIQKWTDEHPEYQIFDSPDNMEYIQLTQAVLGGFGEQECKQFKDKIIRGVIKEVLVNK